MKNILLIGLLWTASTQIACSQIKPVNWTPEQLEQPSDLAQKITGNEKLPIIICVGPGAIIPHSIDAGMAGTPEGIQKFKEIISNYPIDTPIVVYCGCCPFEHCPNVRPAIAELKKEGFKDFKLLNLPQNIRTDWIAKGYPTVKN